jgi:hypothetical protein
MNENPTKIKITGKVNYEDEITVGQAAKIIHYLNSDADDDLGGGGLDDAPPDPKKKSRTKKVETPRDALDLSGASTNPEKIVALGAFVVMDSEVETFKVEDVKSQFRRARETPPANFGRDLGVAISSGWIFEADDAPGEYYLNSKIDPIFDGDFAFPKTSGGAGSRQRGAAKKSSPKAKSVKTAKPETLADVDEFRSTLDGYPGYSKMKTEKDRLLWVVNYMREKHDRKGLTNKEIAWISDHIGTGIPSDNVAGAFNSAKSPGYAIRSTMDNTIKMTDEGIAHLKSLTVEA